MTAIWDQARIVVCCGSGGVGKTNVAAAIAAGAAHAGRRTAVMTIDPAPRLADALGIPTDGIKGCDVDPARFSAYGLDTGDRLHAVIPNTRAILDDIVTQLTPSPEVRDRILRNPIYRRLSTTVAGSHEYASLEQFYRLTTDPRYDLVVLDTPPCQHVGQFFAAPRQWLQLINPDTLALLGRLGRRAPGWGALMRLGEVAMRSALGKLAGADTVTQLVALLQGLKDVYGPLARRAEEVETLLRADNTYFMLVTSPRLSPASHLGAVRQSLRGMGAIRCRGVLNRVTPEVIATAEAGAATDDLPETIRGPILAALKAGSDATDRARRTRQALDEICDGEPVFEIPELPPTLEEAARIASITPHLHATATGED